MIAPWLQPADVLGAMQAGARTGLAQRAQWQNEAEAAQRLRMAYDQMAALNQRAEMEMAMRAQQSEAANALREAQLTSLDAYRKGELERKNEALGYQRDSLGFRKEQQDALNEYRNQMNAQRDQTFGLREQMLKLQQDKEGRISENVLDPTTRMELQRLQDERSNYAKIVASSMAGQQKLDPENLTAVNSKLAELDWQIAATVAKARGENPPPKPTPAVVQPKQPWGEWLSSLLGGGGGSPPAQQGYGWTPQATPQGATAPAQRVRRYNPETGNFE